jgi:hypothetical protein
MIMSIIRRTTVAARDDDLAVLATEARARGLSLSRMLGELVAERAQTLRSQHRPRLAIFRADVSIAGAIENENPASRPFRP